MIDAKMKPKQGKDEKGHALYLDSFTNADENEIISLMPRIKKIGQRLIFSPNGKHENNARRRSFENEAVHLTSPI